jgi:hypothetical protein
MNSTIRCAPAAALAAALAFAAPHAEAAAKRSPGDSGATGTHAEEYRANTSGQAAAGAAVSGTPVKPGVPAKPNNTTSTGRERTGPGAQPEEYNAAGSKAPIVYDTVHNVRVKPDTTTATGRAWRDSVRGTTGPTRPGGAAPRPTAPRTPMEMPGSGGADPSVPGSGPAR